MFQSRDNHGRRVGMNQKIKRDFLEEAGQVLHLLETDRT